MITELNIFEAIEQQDLMEVACDTSTDSEEGTVCIASLNHEGIDLGTNMTLGTIAIINLIQLNYIACIGVYYNIGEITAKTVAKAYWKEEVNCELADLGLDEQWIFKNDAGSLSGTYDDAMEYADKHRSHNIYSHDCSERCRKKGTVWFNSPNFIFGTAISFDNLKCILNISINFRTW